MFRARKPVPVNFLSIHILILCYNNSEGKLKKIVQFIKEWFKNLTAEQKRQLIIICTVIFVVLLTLSVIIPMIGSGTTEEKLTEPDRMFISVPIPGEELFLPDEPDYIPGVLLERERRLSWTDEDASEHWQDPLKYGEEQWREKIEASIDEFLERVP
jgi:hypothetical protein